MTVSTSSQPTDIVFVIEGTALSGAYIQELKQHYIIPTLEYFSGGHIDDKDSGSDSNYTLFGLVIFHSADILPGYLTQAIGPITTPSKMLIQLDKIQYSGGHGEATSHVGEGLSTGLMCLQDLTSFRNSLPESPQAMKHIILVCNCKPYGIPVSEAIGSDGLYKGQTAEQLASLMSDRGIRLSILAPRKIPALINLFDRGGGDITNQKGYARDPRHLVLLNGFHLQERPATPQPRAPAEVNYPVTSSSSITPNQQAGNPATVAQQPIPTAGLIASGPVQPQQGPVQPVQLPRSPAAPTSSPVISQQTHQPLTQNNQPPTQAPTTTSGQFAQGQPHQLTPQQMVQLQQQHQNMQARNPRLAMPNINRMQVPQQGIQPQGQPSSQQLQPQQSLNQQISQGPPNSTPISQALTSGTQMTPQPITHQQQVTKHNINQQQIGQQQQISKQQQINSQQLNPQPFSQQVNPSQQQMNQQLNQQLDNQQPQGSQQQTLQQHAMQQQAIQQHAMQQQALQQQQAIQQQQVLQQQQAMQQQAIQQQRWSNHMTQQQPQQQQPIQMPMQQTRMNVPGGQLSTQAQSPTPSLQRAPQEIIARLNQPPITVTSQQTGPGLIPAPQQPNLQRERRTIWKGLLEWHEKQKGPPEGQKIPRQVPCQVSANVVNNEPEVKGDGWPQKLIMQLIPKAIVGNLGGTYFLDVKTVLFMLQTCDALASLTRVMESGFAGCVHFTGTGMQQSACTIKVLILLYSKERHAYLGFIPNDQTGFVDRIRKVIQQQKTQQAVLRQGAAAPNISTFGGPQQGGPRLQQPGGNMQGGGAVHSGMLGVQTQGQPRATLQIGQGQAPLPVQHQQQGPNQLQSQGVPPSQLQPLGGSVNPQPSAAFDPKLSEIEEERQQNALQIQQLQQALEAAQQRQRMMSSHQMQPGSSPNPGGPQMIGQGQMAMASSVMHNTGPGQVSSQMAPSQQPQQMVPSQQPQQMQQLQRMLRPSTVAQANPGLKHLLQQQTGHVAPQGGFRPMMGMQRMHGPGPIQGQRGGVQGQGQGQLGQGQQQYEDVGILDLLK